MNRSDRNIEISIKNAVDELTPDLRNDLLNELNLDPTSTKPVAGHIKVSKTGKRRKMYKTFAGLAAALMLVVGLTQILKDPDVFAVVDLDVNPSVELSVDNKARVVSAKAINKEGEDILKDMNMEGSDITVACNAVVGAMLTKGYLTNTTNSILVSVRSNEESAGRTMEKDLSKRLNSYLDQSEITGAVMGQYVVDDEELDAFAEQNGISEGKAWLIRNLMAADERLTKESLLKLSTQDLILLCRDKKIKVESVYGTVDTSRFITKEKAISMAAEKAQVAEENIIWSNVEFDCDDGALIYEVDFIADGMEYDFKLEATSGKVISWDSEVDQSSYSNGGESSGSSNSGSSGNSGNSGSSSGSVNSGGSDSGGNSGSSNNSVKPTKKNTSGGSGGSYKKDYDDDDDDYDDHDDDRDDDHDDDRDDDHDDDDD